MPTNNHVPPALMSAERNVLGALLLEGELCHYVIDILPPHHGTWFYHAAHQLIFQAILTLYERHEPIDLHTVSNVLIQREQLQKIGGSRYLAELMESVVSTANITFHARLIREKAIYRSLINIASCLSDSAYRGDNLQDIIGSTYDALMQISELQNSADFVTMEQVVPRIISEAQRPRSQMLTGLNTGFPELNRLTGGFQNADLIIVAARPGQGKTSLGLQFAITAASTQDHPVVIFSLEMSKEQLVQRMICAEARIDASRFRQGQLQRAEWDQIMSISSGLQYLPIFIDETPGLTTVDMRARLRRIRAQHGLACIIVDYLQLISPKRHRDNRTMEVSEISRDLKLMAKEFDVPVIAMAQLSRAVESRQPPIPQLSDLRDSGAIENDADVVLFIYRGDIYQPNTDTGVKLMLAKHRNGPTGEVKLIFQHDYARFDSVVREP